MLIIYTHTHVWAPRPLVKDLELEDATIHENEKEFIYMYMCVYGVLLNLLPEIHSHILNSWVGLKSFWFFVQYCCFHEGDSQVHLYIYKPDNASLLWSTELSLTRPGLLDLNDSFLFKHDVKTTQLNKNLPESQHLQNCNNQNQIKI